MKKASTSFTMRRWSRPTVAATEKVVRYRVDGGVEREVAGEEIFYALGRVPERGGARARARRHRVRPGGGIEVDATMRTTNPDVYAVGDVTGEYMLVHVAIYQGEVAARNACMNLDECGDYRLVGAHTIFSDPQVAAVGASEKALATPRHLLRARPLRFRRARESPVPREDQGLREDDGRPGERPDPGCGVIGPQASELIHEMIVAMTYDSTVDQFMRIPHLHPTLAEIWTYPAEICAAQLGMKDARRRADRDGDERQDRGAESAALLICAWRFCRRSQ